MFGILLAGLAIYLYSIETSLWWVGAAAFISFGSFGVAFEKLKSKKSDTAVRDTPKTQKYKTTIPKFTALKKLKNGEMKLDEIKNDMWLLQSFIIITNLIYIKILQIIN